MMLSSKAIQRRKSLHQQTYDVLKNNILAGHIAPGARLVETQLAEQLQVSRTPIREAIRQLQREELVEADENGWLRVASLSIAEARHLYDCRIALETLAVQEACANLTPGKLQKLARCVAEAQKWLSEDVTPEQSLKLLEIDYQFHSTIAQISGNHCLVSLLEQVFDKMTLLRTKTTRNNPRVLEIGSEHQTIYDAIATGDPDIAVAAIQNHLNASKKRVVKELEALTAAANYE
ncbi:MAG: GntR family transcriptional regulator [Jaaginema sp. PMC 1079.18]|nr:GntR family transcriptional regulator [Jaaginema sp. PMC 1080.18]MEC4850054.1 GntR family transcriptional regulator [Jaaginema sp. PMC 1079.18]MEC4865154.1 GntR family transcriptional regulator [Jaaginema sp. PMC 1078.18]